MSNDTVKRYDLVTNYRCGSCIEEMEPSDDGEWARWDDVLVMHDRLVSEKYELEKRRLANVERLQQTRYELLQALKGLRALILGECGASTYECADGERADAAIAKAEAR